MIINIKNKNDLITIDFRIKQIRYLEDIKQMGYIHFININEDEVFFLNRFFKEIQQDKKRDFFILVKNILEDFKTDFKINIKDLEILK